MSDFFKQGHADLHAKAENAALPAAMASGTIGREVYVRLIRAEYLVHRTLDARLIAARSASPAIDKLVLDTHLFGDHFAADLEHFGIDPDAVSPTLAAEAFIGLIDEVEAADPTLLLAIHYVRLGASNGNRYVAKKIRPALGLEEIDSAPGTRHLDPFGPEQRGIWDAFKRELDQWSFTDEQRTALVDTARRVFGAVMAIHAEASESGAA
ncbi:MAG: biliverdin-producing heme oxygenase [Planctomycetota bacterium]